uniref:Uncharacterized protein n=2 Tax=Chenopodium quinoa TaxID=63459 RepID=A0A803MVX6_CHEQI
MSDTRFLENGKYFYDAKNDHGVGDDVGFHNNNNVEFANTFSRNGNEYENGNNEYETQGREGYNYYHGNDEYNVKEGREGYKPKKFPSEYDTMEEYDREQGYINGHEGEYVP